MIMNVYDIVNTMTSGTKLIINLFNDDDTLLFDNNIDCICVERPDLLSYRVCHISAYDISDCSIAYHIDDNDVYSHPCLSCVELTVYKPTLISRMMVKLRRQVPEYESLKTSFDCISSILLSNLKLCFIRLLFNKWFIPDGYLESMYLQNCADTIRTKINYKYLYIYTKNIRAISTKKYKYPVFRIWVAQFTEETAKEKYLGFINWEHEFYDGTMIFTLEPQPKWLQDYDTIKRQLRGNIISKEEIQKVVDFVANNYELIRGAWDVNTDMFGTYQYGFDITKLKSIK